nr:Unknown Function [uncultured bacterium]
MTAQEIVAAVKSLGLPQESYVVFGSCPMALANLREAGDIDLLVTPEVFEQLGARGWVMMHKGKDDNPLTKDIFEAHQHWNFSSYRPTLKHLQKTATMYHSVPFAALSEVRKWKAASGRPKDLVDVAMIDTYLTGIND